MRGALITVNGFSFFLIIASLIGCASVSKNTESDYKNWSAARLFDEYTVKQEAYVTKADCCEKRFKGKRYQCYKWFYKQNKELMMQLSKKSSWGDDTFFQLFLSEINSCIQP